MSKKNKDSAEAFFKMLDQIDLDYRSMKKQEVVEEVVCKDDNSTQDKYWKYRELNYLECKNRRTRKIVFWICWFFFNVPTIWYFASEGSWWPVCIYVPVMTIILMLMAYACSRRDLKKAKIDLMLKDWEFN